MQGTITAGDGMHVLLLTFDLGDIPDKLRVRPCLVVQVLQGYLIPEACALPNPLGISLSSRISRIVCLVSLLFPPRHRASLSLYPMCSRRPNVRLAVISTTLTTNVPATVRSTPSSRDRLQILQWR